MRKAYPTLKDIRTYAVMPLNEECGMLEWVVNTVPMRAILIKGYDRRDVKTYVSDPRSAVSPNLRS
jgi:hypothetical protein